MDKLALWMRDHTTPLPADEIATLLGAFNAHAAATGLAQQIVAEAPDTAHVELAKAAQRWAWQEHRLLPGATPDRPFCRPDAPPPAWVLQALALTEGAEQRTTIQHQEHGAPFTPAVGTIVSEAMAQLVVEALHAAADHRFEGWTRPPDAAPYYADKDGRRMTVADNDQRTNISQAQADRFWHTVMSLDDDKVSAFLICLARWFSAQGERPALADERVHVTDILAFQGVARHVHGGYRKEQKQKGARDILTLNSIWVSGPQVIHEQDKRGRRREKVVMVDSRLIEVAIESQLEFWEEGTPYAFLIRPGRWAQPYVGGHNRLTAQLLRPVMQYDPRQGVGKIAMRLGIYLTFQWRIRASYGNYDQPWRVRTLLDGAHVPVPTDRRVYQRFRDQVEAALDALQRDGVIAGWAYARGIDDELPKYGWFPHWLDWTVSIALPETLRAHYTGIAAVKRAALSPAKQGQGEASQAAQGRRKSS